VPAAPQAASPSPQPSGPPPPPPSSSGHSLRGSQSGPQCLAGHLHLATATARAMEPWREARRGIPAPGSQRKEERRARPRPSPPGAKPLHRILILTIATSAPLLLPLWLLLLGSCLRTSALPALGTRCRGALGPHPASPRVPSQVALCRETEVSARPAAGTPSQLTRYPLRRLPTVPTTVPTESSQRVPAGVSTGHPRRGLQWSEHRRVQADDRGSGSTSPTRGGDPLRPDPPLQPELLPATPATSPPPSPRPRTSRRCRAPGSSWWGPCPQASRAWQFDRAAQTLLPGQRAPADRHNSGAGAEARGGVREWTGTVTELSSFLCTPHAGGGDPGRHFVDAKYTGCTTSPSRCTSTRGNPRRTCPTSSSLCPARPSPSRPTPQGSQAEPAHPPSTASMGTSTTPTVPNRVSKPRDLGNEQLTV